MKTGLQMVKDGYELINVDAINALITGKVYMFQRPQNSSLQDIVLNTLIITNDQLQNGVFNVNIHCPNLKLTINGESDVTQPDIAKLTEVASAIVQIVADYNGFDFYLSCLSPGIMLRDVDDNWYTNIRVNYSAFQQNYTNI